MDNGHPQGGEPLQHWLERRGHRLRYIHVAHPISVLGLPHFASLLRLVPECKLPQYDLAFDVL